MVMFMALYGKHMVNIPLKWGFAGYLCQLYLVGGAITILKNMKTTNGRLQYTVSICQYINGFHNIYIYIWFSMGRMTFPYEMERSNNV